MSISSGLPRTHIMEKELYPYIPSGEGVYGAIVIEAPKGDIEKPQLCSSMADLLKKFTANGKPEVGADLAFFSAEAFLTKSAALWVMRIQNNAELGGLVVAKASSASVNAAIGAGFDDIAEYIFADTVNDSLLFYAINHGEWSDHVAVKIFNHHVPQNITAANISVNEVTTAFSAITDGPDYGTGEAIKFMKKNANDTLPTGITEGTTYYAVKTGVNKLKVATTMANALAEVPVTMTLTGHALATGSSFTLISADEKCKQPGAFCVEVWKRENVNSNPVLVETWICSRLHIKDGYGQNIYVEDILLGSDYIRAYDNSLVGTTAIGDVFPKAQCVALYMDKGDDGDACSDSQYIAALAKFTSVEEYPVTVFMDGGHASPAYHQALAQFCDNRKSCIAIGSIPYDRVARSDYLMSSANYKQIDCNVSSFRFAYAFPHVLIYDRYNDRQIYAAPDGYLAANISANAANEEIWFVPAGEKRGKVSPALSLRRKISETEAGYLFDRGINPLMQIIGRGIRIMGDKTAYPTPGDFQDLSTVLLLITIQPAIKKWLDLNVLFEFNTASTRAFVRESINSYMGGIFSRMGCEGWYVVCDESNNPESDRVRHVFNVDLFVKPMKSIRYINFTTILTGGNNPAAVVGTR